MKITPLPNEPVQLEMSQSALEILAMTGQGKRNRLNRIRHNLLRELAAMNKELKRTPNKLRPNERKMTK